MAGGLTGQGPKRCGGAFDHCFLVVEKERNGAVETECRMCCSFGERQVEGQATALANEGGNGIECGSGVVGPWWRLDVELEM